MKQDHKITAFTLSEMLIVLILTAVVVGLAFSVLSLVQRHMTSIQNNFQQATALNKLETSLWIDFNRYNTIKYNDIENQMVFSSEIDSIHYTFTKEYIVKTLDTFRIPLDNKTVFFNGDVIQNGTIDAFKLETSKAFQNQKLFIYKDNAASAYMK
ncbi:type II secretion system protein J [uncultured Lacinutrix sp.]|uniref:PulJ/GspJ family protein n=1 Tax=uncultured Lacinutrix sp. TaxID=574032 RepID=UPI0026219FC5|nr:prepilin-type N-terminal cleavage/methylation domain-containing protein [uncultured Lacinutrix sp.]